MIDHYITLTVTFLAAVAGGAALVSSRTGSIRVRCYRRAVASLAFLYVGAYTWLLFNPEHRLGWSHVMAGVSIPAWIIVWIVPNITHMFGNQRRRKLT